MVVHAKICNIFVIYGLQNTEFLEKMKKENTSFYVIEHIFRKHFVSLQRYKIKERCKTLLSETRRAQKDENYEKECK